MAPGGLLHLETGAPPAASRGGSQSALPWTRQGVGMSLRPDHEAEPGGRALHIESLRQIHFGLGNLFPRQRPGFFYSTLKFPARGLMWAGRLPHRGSGIWAQFQKK